MITSDNHGEEKEPGELSQLSVEKEAAAQAVPAKEEAKPTASAPKKMASVSPYAEGLIAELEKALASRNGDDLSNQVFDAECAGLEDQIDLTWYEQ